MGGEETFGGTGERFDMRDEERGPKYYRGPMPELSAMFSLAEHLGVDATTAGGMLINGTAGPAIEARNEQLAEEKRHVEEEYRRLHPLDGREAMRRLEAKFIPRDAGELLAELERKRLPA